MKRLALLAALTTALIVAASPVVVRANPSTGVGVVTFWCQVKLTFPVAFSASKTNCEGSALGSVAAAASKPGALVFAGLPPKVPLVGPKCNIACYVNLYVDDIMYANVCLVAGEPSIAGTATGNFGIQGTLVGSTIGPAYVRGSFAYTRLGLVWIASLSNVGGANGVDVKGTQPSGSGSGVAAGLFVPKLVNETIGVCGGPQQNNFDIYGTAVFTVA